MKTRELPTTTISFLRQSNEHENNETIFLTNVELSELRKEKEINHETLSKLFYFLCSQKATLNENINKIIKKQIHMKLNICAKYI